MRCSNLGSLTFMFALLTGCGGGGSGQTETTETETAGSTGSGSTTAPTTTAPTTTAAEGCGNGAIEGDEVCDGADLGGKTCEDIDPLFSSGALVCADDCMSLDASNCELPPGTALVTLNELTSEGALAGPWMGKGDLIELYNAGDMPADLSGWQLSDDMTLPVGKTYVFPDGTTLGPKQWLVLAEFNDVTAEGDFPFGLSQSAVETVVLVGSGGQMIDTVTFDGVKATVSYCRVPDGTGAWQQCDQTFEAQNAAAASFCGDGAKNGAELCDGTDLGGQTCLGLDLGFMGGTLACAPDCTFDATGCDSGSTLVLNELEATNDDIELYNAGNAPVDLSGWILTDDLVDANYNPVADAEKMIFTAQTTLGAKQYLVVKKGMGQNEHPFGLGTTGDTVTLLQPNLQVVDLVAYAMDEATTSYCRLPDGPGGEWTPVCTPTLGAPNQP